MTDNSQSDKEQPTPRTDAAGRGWSPLHGAFCYVHEDLARQLERELAEANDTIGTLRIAAEHLEREYVAAARPSLAAPTDEQLREIAKTHARNATNPVGAMFQAHPQETFRAEEVIFYALKEAAALSHTEQQDGECICKGNWRAIVKETEALIGKRFVNVRGEKYRFFGIVHGDDDYYYGMNGTAGMRLLSCVGDFTGHGYTLLPEGMADEAPRSTPAPKERP